MDITNKIDYEILKGASTVWWSVLWTHLAILGESLE